MIHVPVSFVQLGLHGTQHQKQCFQDMNVLYSTSEILSLGRARGKEREREREIERESQRTMIIFVFAIVCSKHLREEQNQ